MSGSTYHYVNARGEAVMSYDVFKAMSLEALCRWVCK
jgi:hypothetical protein